MFFLDFLSDLERPWTDVTYVALGQCHYRLFPE